MLLNGSELCQLNLERVFSLGSCYGNCATGLFDLDHCFGDGSRYVALLDNFEKNDN